MARTVVALLERRDRLDAFASFHIGGNWDADGSAMVAAIRRAVARRIGSEPRVHRFPWWLLALAAPFVESYAELHEMRYLWRESLRLDDSRLVAIFGREPHTPLDEAVEATLDAFGSLGNGPSVDASRRGLQHSDFVETLRHPDSVKTAVHEPGHKRDARASLMLCSPVAQSLCLRPMKIQANGIDIEVLVEGPADGEPLLLIMGLGMQLIAWPDEMIDELSKRGFRVIRFDNRDVGLSTHMDHLGVPNLWLATMQYSMHMPVSAPYRLQDMAADTLGVLDALGIAQAHVCGASMGGMIAQHLAAQHPDRVASLALMMTSSGSRLLPKPHWRVRQALMPPPRGLPIEAKVEHLTRSMHVIGSPAYRPDPERQRARLEAVVRRSWRPAGALRQMLAVAADGDRSPLLRKLEVPAVVIHGDADPLVPPPAANDLVRKLRGAKLDLIPGMGHDLPLPLVERLVDDIEGNAERARVALT